MATQRKHYSSTTTPTSLSSLVNSATPGDTEVINVNTISTGAWPSVPFTIGVDRGTADEEAMLVTAISATTMTVERGYDGTSAVEHLSGAAVEHCVLREDYDDANDHIYNDLRDDHSQYLTLGRASDYFPKVYTGTSPVHLNPVTTTYETVNTLTIPSATFSRKAQVTGMIPLLLVAADQGHIARILMGSSTVIAYARWSGPSQGALVIVTDWVTLAPGSSYQMRTQFKRTSGSGGDVEGDSDLNKITALVVPNI